MNMIEVTAAIVNRSGKIMICQRPADKACGLLWEFPGGKIESGETGEQCIVRECQEELGITLAVKRKVTDVIYEYPNRVVHLYFYLCDIVEGEPLKKEHNDIAWITPDEIPNYEFCPADAKMLSSVRSLSEVLS